MSLEIVNGYPCFNCTDVEYAKRGVDPAHPENDPKATTGRAKGADPQVAETREAAVVFGEGLKAVGAEKGAERDSDSLRLSRPGSTLDITV